MSTYSYVLELFTLSPEDPIMIIVCMGLFLVFWKAVDRNFFSHYMPLYEARLQATEGNVLVAKNTIEQAREIENEVQEALNQARLEALTKRGEAIAEVKKAAESRYSAAEMEIQAQIKAARQATEQRAHEVRQKLQGNIPELVDTAVESLIN